MYAIFEDGSHQFRVQTGDTIAVDLRADAELGSTLEFDKVLLLAGGDGAAVIGQPQVVGAKVVGTVVRTLKGKKIIIQKFRRRKNYRRRNGHRQQHTLVQITEVVAPA